MTDTLDLAAIEARAEAATKGPWESRDYPNDEVWDSKGIWLADVRNEETAAFIAHAREDIPALLARVRELEAALAEMTEQRNHYMNQMGRWVDKPPERIGR